MQCDRLFRGMEFSTLNSHAIILGTLNYLCCTCQVLATHYGWREK